jgi:predicted DNA-binding transcriptional regulator AlpA
MSAKGMAAGGFGPDSQNSGGGPDNINPVKADGGCPVQPALAQAIADAAAIVAERIFTTLSGRIFSPRLKLLNLEQVIAATGLGKSTLYHLINMGEFPKPQKGLGKNYWRESTLIAWAERNDPN